jgi:septal ring factor EnvC (AmiA/AmiB activator)
MPPKKSMDERMPADVIRLRAELKRIAETLEAKQQAMPDLEAEIQVMQDRRREEDAKLSEQQSQLYR